jgi:hypothetical protein
MLSGSSNRNDLRHNYDVIVNFKQHYLLFHIFFSSNLFVVQKITCHS